MEKTYLEIESYDPKTRKERGSRVLTYPEEYFAAIADSIQDLQLNDVFEDLFGDVVQVGIAPDGNSLTLKGGELFTLRVSKRAQYEEV